MPLPDVPMKQEPNGEDGPMATQIKRADFDRRDGEIHTRIEELTTDATNALLESDVDGHERITREITQQRQNLESNAAAREEWERREADRNRQRARELNADRVAAGARVDAAILALVGEYDAYFAIASEHANVISLGGLTDRLISDARASDHEVAGAFAQAAHGRPAGALPWLANVPASDRRTLADADRDLADRVTQEAGPDA